MYCVSSKYCGGGSIRTFERFPDHFVSICCEEVDWWYSYLFLIIYSDNFPAVKWFHPMLSWLVIFSFGGTWSRWKMLMLPSSWWSILLLTCFLTCQEVQVSSLSFTPIFQICPPCPGVGRAAGHMWLGPAQGVHFFYTRSHLSALKSCALIFWTNFQFIFTFK